jgi:hypothetical protein
MIYKGKRRAAFTLLETLTIMLALTVAMAMSAVILAGVLQIQQASKRSLERTSARSALADQFRADVAGSRGVMKDVGDVHASESCLILGGTSSSIVYRFEEGRIERQNRSLDGTILHRAMLGPPVDRIRFTRDDHNRRVITMFLDQSADKPQARRTWIFWASLGGDRR